MSMTVVVTVVVTRNVSDRVRGFLAWSMLELAPGVYTAPCITPAVRDRIWRVLSDWFPNEADASIVILRADSAKPGDQAAATLSLPPIALVELDGMLATLR